MSSYFEIDVFSHQPFRGNPLAVIANADSLTSEQMQTIAVWTNFSETTFLLPPTDPNADYAVRIFTPRGEYDFAGHPTVGTARAWLELGGTPHTPGVIIQECPAGLVRVRSESKPGEERVLSFATPERTKTGPLEATDLHTIARDFGLDAGEIVSHTWGSNGPEFRIVQLESAERVRALRPSESRAPMRVGFVGLEPQGADAPEWAYEVRFFGVGYEDAVTGSLQGSIAQWLRERELVPSRYMARQGSVMGRDGRISVYDDGSDVWIGGRTHVTVRGSIELPAALAR